MLALLDKSVQACEASGVLQIGRIQQTSPGPLSRDSRWGVEALPDVFKLGAVPVRIG